MRAAVVTEAHDLEVVDVPDPTPGDGELVVRVTACGICGSDLKAVGSMRPGTVMGHEFCGEVVAVGPGVDGRWREGDAVAAMPLIGCGRCAACVTGDLVHCPSVDLLGVAGGAGAYAEFVRVSAAGSFPLPEPLQDGSGALVEPLAVGLHAVNRAGLRPGESVLVVGAGPVGLAVAAWAAVAGAGELVVSDPAAHRRAGAAAVRATGAVDPTAEPLGGPYDVVFECVGAPGMLDTCVGAAVAHGRVVVVGVCMQPDPFLPVLALVKEVSLLFVVYYLRREFEHTVRALASGRIDPAVFITDRVPLEGVGGAFRELMKPTTQRKVLVVPGEAA